MEISPLHAAMAGLTSHGVKLAVAANNIANLNTYSYKKNQAYIEANALNLPEARVTGSTAPGPFIPQPLGLPGGEAFIEMSNVDLTEEFLQMKLAEFGYKASASLVYAGDEMVGTILDILA